MCLSPLVLSRQRDGKLKIVLSVKSILRKYFSHEYFKTIPWCHVTCLFTYLENEFAKLQKERTCIMNAATYTKVWHSVPQGKMLFLQSSICGIFVWDGQLQFGGKLLLKAEETPTKQVVPEIQFSILLNCSLNFTKFNRVFLQFAIFCQILAESCQYWLGRAKKRDCPMWRLNPQPPDHHSNALPTELSHYLVVCESLRPL